MRILIDGDGCPVRKQTIMEGLRRKIDVWIVQSVEHNVKEEEAEGLRFITVDNSYQAADMRIINLMEPGDLVITGDYGLAALVLGKKGYALSPMGKVFSEERMDQMLFERHVAASVRRKGGRTKGPAPRTKNDDELFLGALRKLLDRIGTVI